MPFIRCGRFCRHSLPSLINPTLTQFILSLNNVCFYVRMRKSKPFGPFTCLVLALMTSAVELGHNGLAAAEESYTCMHANTHTRIITHALQSKECMTLCTPCLLPQLHTAKWTAQEGAPCACYQELVCFDQLHSSKLQRGPLHNFCALAIQPSVLLSCSLKPHFVACFYID